MRARVIVLKVFLSNVFYLQLVVQSHQFHLVQTRVSAPADLSEDKAQPVARDPSLSTFMEHCKSFVCEVMNI